MISAWCSAYFWFSALPAAREQLDAAQLVGELLRMHERHVEEIPQAGSIRASAPRSMARRGDLARERIAGIGPDIAAKHVAGKLVEHDDERQRAVIACFP